MYFCQSTIDLRKDIVSALITGVHFLARIVFHIPERIIRSNRPKSISEKYIPLLMCPAMSISVGQALIRTEVWLHKLAAA